jgi:hypothetical protein
VDVGQARVIRRGLGVRRLFNGLSASSGRLHAADSLNFAEHGEFSDSEQLSYTASPAPPISTKPPDASSMRRLRLPARPPSRVRRIRGNQAQLAEK